MIGKGHRERTLKGRRMEDNEINQGYGWFGRGTNQSGRSTWEERGLDRGGDEKVGGTPRGGGIRGKGEGGMDGWDGISTTAVG
jgi:hypothetical protein